MEVNYKLLCFMLFAVFTVLGYFEGFSGSKAVGAAIFAAGQVWLAAFAVINALKK